MHCEVHRVAGLHERRRIDRHRVAARVEVHRERHDAVAQRGHEDLVRRRIANVLHVDVAVALEAGRHRDVLDRAGRIRMEPRVRIHLVALDRDQAAARVRRADRDLDLLARLVVVLRERHLQLRVAVERARDVRVARDRILDPVHRRAGRVADHERITARLVGAQREVGPAAGIASGLSSTGTSFSRESYLYAPESCLVSTDT